MRDSNWKVATLVTVAGVAGLIVCVSAALGHRSHDVFRFFCYLALACAAARMKVRLPGVTGTMSVNFVFVLLGVLEMEPLEALVIGCSGALLQCIWHTKKSK